VRFHGEDVRLMRLPGSGVTFTAEYERVQVAVWSHYRLEDFEALEIDVQARLIAAHRLQNTISAVLEFDRAQKAGQ
jgi:hypothetical protein